MKTVMAIDPGKSGAFAVSIGDKVVTHNMPESEGDRVELLRDYCDAANVEGWPVVCVLEQVGGYVGKAQPGSAMFVFGENFGFLKGVIQALRMRLVLVRPQVWQRGLGVGTARAHGGGRFWKARLKAESQRRFPQLRVTNQNADALLILDWALTEQNVERLPAVLTKEPLT